VLNNPKKSQPDKAFMNISVEEMSAKIQARDQELNRKNCFILILFFVAFVLVILVGAWYYGAWMLETVGAVGQLVGSLWRLEWLAAGQIFLQYKLSFFLLGIFAGFILFLFIVFQIGEILIDLTLEGLSSLFT